MGAEKAIAFEPDQRNFRKLSDYAGSVLDSLDLTCVNAVAWSENTSLAFDSSGNRNAGVLRADVQNSKNEVSAFTVDSVIDGESVDYIKYDVEGSEYEALMGSTKTIAEFAPTLLVSAYHRSEDLFKLPLLLHQLNKEYKIYLRKLRYIPAWDLNLYAVKEVKNV